MVEEVRTAGSAEPQDRGMSVGEAPPGGTVEGALAAAMQGGDEAAFAALVERHQRELQVHCYRMLGSLEDAEDLVQETFLRAWRKRASFSFQDRWSVRAWLYRIATNACLDALATSRHRVAARRAAKAMAQSGGSSNPAEIPWLQPYPDRLLEGIADSDAGPEAVVVAKETMRLAFLAAIQHLPPKQRATLILRDVLGWSAKETASLLEASVASVNSALQRARATMKQHLPPRRLEWAPGSDLSQEERALLQRFVDANERGDAAAFAALLSEDARLTMPPLPTWWEGRDAIVAAMAEGPFLPEFGHLRLVPTRANGQPAAAVYLRRPGDSTYRGLGIDVLRVEDGKVVEVTSFSCQPLGPRFSDDEVPDLLAAFGLPRTL
jgi:RNA polymerase sigma-70 factor, ECF subfamily